MPTSVTGPALEHRRSDWQSEAFGNPWQVTSSELILKRLGRRSNQHPLTAEKGWHQPGKGLPDGSSGIHDQHAAFSGFSHDCARHQSLPLPVHEGSRRDRPSAARTKGIADGRLKVHQAGSLGSSSVSSRTISSRRPKRRFFRRRSMS